MKAGGRPPQVGPPPLSRLWDEDPLPPPTPPPQNSTANQPLVSTLASGSSSPPLIACRGRWGCVGRAQYTVFPAPGGWTGLAAAWVPISLERKGAVGEVSQKGRRWR